MPTLDPPSVPDPIAAVLYTPLAGDPHRVCAAGRCGARPPLFRDLVPLPEGLVPTLRTPCSECPSVGMEHWRPAQRNHRGACAIRGEGSLCTKAGLPGAKGQRTSLVLGWEGVLLSEGMGRAKDRLAGAEDEMLGQGPMELGGGWLWDKIGNPHGDPVWYLQGGPMTWRSYSSRETRERPTLGDIDALAVPPAGIGRLEPAWALAVVLVDRFGGEAVLLRRADVPAREVEM
jgi:hypothetical protein